MDGKEKEVGPEWKPPTRYVPVGCGLRRYGRDLVCVERPVTTWPPIEACSGCFFRRSQMGNGVLVNCNDIQCSSFDRMDGRNVWFVEKEGAE